MHALRENALTMVAPTRLHTWLTVAVIAVPLACGAIEAPPGTAHSKAVRCIETAGHHDGDTFKCTTAGGDMLTVRVAGIDAPETGQGYWRLARARLRDLAAPGSLVDCYKRDRFGRSVCRLTSSDGQDAADVLLAEGWVWYPLAYAHEDESAHRLRRIELQARAREARLGLWAEANPMPPWECRRLREQRQRCR